MDQIIPAVDPDPSPVALSSELALSELAETNINGIDTVCSPNPITGHLAELFWHGLPLPDLEG